MPKRLHLITGGAQTPTSRMLRARTARALPTTTILAQEDENRRAGVLLELSELVLQQPGVHIEQGVSHTVRFTVVGPAGFPLLTATVLPEAVDEELLVALQHFMARRGGTGPREGK